MAKPLNKLPVVQYAESLPTTLLTSTQLSEALKVRGIEMAADRIMELADAYYIPHFRVDGGPPLFVANEARNWIAKNLAQRIDGQRLPPEYRVLVNPLPGMDLGLNGCPPALSQFADRLIVQQAISVCGIYFLCRGGEVVYVGQSCSTGARIGTHASEERKKFDRAYILPVPPSALDALEGAFIRALNPPDNRNAPFMFHQDGEIFSAHGIELAAGQRPVVPVLSDAVDGLGADLVEERLAATALRTAETVESVTGLPSNSSLLSQHDPTSEKERL